MSSFTFKAPDGNSFEVKVPQGVTFEQAQAAFKQQIDTGSLVGFKPGDVLSAATQAADGFTSAQSQLVQTTGSLTGLLPPGINLNSITATIGAAGQSAAAQAQAALAGGSAAFNSLTTGASAATASISAALNSASRSSVIPGINPILPAVIGALTGAAATVGSLASNAVKTMNSAIGGLPGVPINVADFTKQAAALAPIAGLKLPDVTGILAQTKNLVGQSADTVSNILGVGKFGFDANQLERAGLIKPGTTAAFLELGNKDIVSVLKSPTVWTGKEGVKSLTGLLNNSALQDKVQQGLMTAGLDSLRSVGVPVDIMQPQALAGLAMNAAKSVEKTVAWVKGATGLPTDIKAKFDVAAASGAFAVNLTQTKVELAAKQEIIAVPASSTVNTETQTAAGKRIVNNDKIPTIAVSGSPQSVVKLLIDTWRDFLSSTTAQLASLEDNIILLEKQSSITQEQWNKLNSESQIISTTYAAQDPNLQNAAASAVNKLLPGEQAALLIYLQTTQQVSVTAVTVVTRLKARVKDLANKIGT